MNDLVDMQMRTRKERRNPLDLPLGQHGTKMFSNFLGLKNFHRIFNWKDLQRYAPHDFSEMSPISQIPYDSSVSMKAAETPKSLAMAWREESQKKSERCWKLDGKCVFVFGGCLVGDMLVFGVFLGVYRIRSNWCEYWIEPHQSFGMNPERESLCKSAIYPTKLVTSSSTRSPPNTSQVNDLQWFVLMFLCFSPN